jgi:KDO2-lipid IV(A) lauroyltransferase
LHPAICYRIGLARWRIEIGQEIPTRKSGSSRSTEEITRDLSQAYEAAIRRDPANWFWVHNRWKLTNTGAGSRDNAGKNRVTETGA